MDTAQRCVYADLFLTVCGEEAVIEFPPERGWPRQPYCRRHAIQILTTLPADQQGEQPMHSGRPNPNGLLGAIRADAAALLADPYADETARDLADGLRRLDTWITEGGHLPLDWVETQPDNQPNPTKPDTGRQAQAKPPQGGDTP